MKYFLYLKWLWYSVFGFRSEYDSNFLLAYVKGEISYNDYVNLKKEYFDLEHSLILALWAVAKHKKSIDVLKTSIKDSLVQVLKSQKNNLETID